MIRQDHQKRRLTMATLVLLSVFSASANAGWPYYPYTPATPVVPPVVDPPKPPPVQQTPEPGTLLMSAIGAGVAGIMARRRKNSAA